MPVASVGFGGQIEFRWEAQVPATTHAEDGNPDAEPHVSMSPVTKKRRHRCQRLGIAMSLRRIFTSQGTDARRLTPARPPVPTHETMCR